MFISWWTETDAGVYHSRRQWMSNRFWPSGRYGRRSVFTVVDADWTCLLSRNQRGVLGPASYSRLIEILFFPPLLTSSLDFIYIKIPGSNLIEKTTLLAWPSLNPEVPSLTVSLVASLSRVLRSMPHRVLIWLAANRETLRRIPITFRRYTNTRQILTP